MLGLPEGFAEQRFTQRTVARNVGLLGPQNCWRGSTSWSCRRACGWRGRPGQQRVRLYLRVTRRLVQRARTTAAELAAAGVEEAEQEEIER